MKREVRRNQRINYNRNDRFLRFRRRKKRIKLIKKILVLLIVFTLIMLGSIKMIQLIIHRHSVHKVNSEIVVEENSNLPFESEPIKDNELAKPQNTIQEITDELEKDSIDENIQEDQWIGTSESGSKFAYDAKVIAEKIAKYDIYNQEEKLVFLTFDDGASTTVTPKVLDILKQYEVKATFFVMGQSIENGGEAAKNIVRREFEEGHAIANHSYSHDYRILYPNRNLNLKNFKADFQKTTDLLKEIIGENFTTRVFRCPGGFMSWNNMDVLTKYMNKNNLVSIDWNCLSMDAEGTKKSASQLFANVKDTAKGKDIVVILMHDTYGKEETAKSLPLIIEYFQKQGYTFKTLV